MEKSEKWEEISLPPVFFSNQPLFQTGGVSSLFNSPFRVIGKRNQMYGLYRNADFDFRPVPLSPEQIDY
ncbi:hypothetical protein ANCCEY_05147 [Ancylostoma ceylanicum]|uniref:Uncharacterized protein n=1 Tax=Ancylostoma ceylanicum TaxID=53326 RepID=A0A0D6LVE6_9BILA|nr:hypothetical protein ANCCEY_05147 [Ancylostoma ceylanicum]